MAGDKFINPYNFIQFPPKKAKAYTDTDRHTGVIEYCITTKTPLFIPNSSSETAFSESEEPDHKSYDFFSYTDLTDAESREGLYQIPVIPGSEMRGVVRSVYETLTDSCMGLLNEDEYPVKRSAEQFRPALLHRKSSGELELCEADSYRIGEKAYRDNPPRGFEKYRNGAVISFLSEGDGISTKPISRYSSDPKQYPKKGYLIKWGMGVRKARYHVFVPKMKLVGGVRLSRDVVERTLTDVIRSYLDQPSLKPENQEAYEAYREDLEDFLGGRAGQYFPVNYSRLDKGILYLSPAVFSKEVSNNSVGSLAGAFAPCKKDYCPACDLFGFVGEKNDASRSSRIGLRICMSRRRKRHQNIISAIRSRFRLWADRN